MYIYVCAYVHTYVCKYVCSLIGSCSARCGPSSARARPSSRASAAPPPGLPVRLLRRRRAARRSRKVRDRNEGSGPDALHAAPDELLPGLYKCPYVVYSKIRSHTNARTYIHTHHTRALSRIRFVCVWATLHCRCKIFRVRKRNNLIFIFFHRYFFPFSAGRFIH